MKQPKQYPPLPAMATDETLIGLYARTAPDIPDWFRSNLEGTMTIEQYIYATENGKIPERILLVSDEELFFQWRLYYAKKMIELLNKK